MSDLVEGVFELLGEAAGPLVEAATEGAGTAFEGSVKLASAVAEGAGPALAVAVDGVGQLAGSVARGVATVANDGLVEAALEAVGSWGESTASPGAAPPATAANAVALPATVTAPAHHRPVQAASVRPSSGANGDAGGTRERRGRKRRQRKGDRQPPG